MLQPQIEACTGLRDFQLTANECSNNFLIGTANLPLKIKDQMATSSRLVKTHPADYD